MFLWSPALFLFAKCFKNSSNDPMFLLLNVPNVPQCYFDNYPFSVSSAVLQSPPLRTAALSLALFSTNQGSETFPGLSLGRSGFCSDDFTFWEVNGEAFDFNKTYQKVQKYTNVTISHSPVSIDSFTLICLFTSVFSVKKEIRQDDGDWRW